MRFLTEMKSTSKINPRDIRFARRLLRNRVFSELLGLFAERAERDGLTKSQLASLLNKDPSQITRWLSEPSNLGLDTISDLLVAMAGQIELSIKPATDSAVSLEAFMREFEAQSSSAREDKISATEKQGAIEIGNGNGTRSDAVIHLLQWSSP